MARTVPLAGVTALIACLHCGCADANKPVSRSSAYERSQQQQLFYEDTERSRNTNALRGPEFGGPVTRPVDETDFRGMVSPPR